MNQRLIDYRVDYADGPWISIKDIRRIIFSLPSLSLLVISGISGFLAAVSVAEFLHQKADGWPSSLSLFSMIEFSSASVMGIICLILWALYVRGGIRRQYRIQEIQSRQRDAA